MFWASRHSKSLVKFIQKYHKLARHSEASTTSEKCLGPPGTPGVCYESYKNIYKLARHSEASTTSEKYFGPPGTPGVCYKSYKNIYKLARHSEVLECL